MRRPFHKSVAAASVLILLTLFVAAGRSSGRAARQAGNPPRQTRCQNGTFSAIARGYYAGTGIAEVRTISVRIDAEVKTPVGQVGRLRGDFITNGPYFSGTGTIMRESVTVIGRLDAAKSSRLVATFYDSTGHSGRLVGTLPSDTGDPAWADQPSE